MAAFHKWHNDKRVNSAGESEGAWRRRGHVKEILADTGVVPIMMSWDGKLMGYVIVWVKENHVAQYYPVDAVIGD